MSTERPDTLPSPPPGLALGLKVIARRPTDDPLRDTHGSTHGGFPWPLTPGAVVSAPDWTPEPECGGGLHLFPFGEGNLSVALGVDDDVSIWQVVAYDPSTAVDLRGKVKVPECVVVLTDYGTTGRARAATYIVAHAPGHCTHFATATAGEGGTATAGYGGTATAGDRGTATAGYRGTATAGDYGTATAGDYGTATAGYGGALGILYYDSTRCVYRRRVAEVDGDRILPGVAYRLDDAGRFVRADGGVS